MEGRIAQLQEFLKESPNDPFLKYALTMEYVKLGEDAQALAGFEDLLSAHEDYVGTYYHFGKFLELKQEQERAIEIYEKGMQIAQNKRNFHALGELRNAQLDRKSTRLNSSHVKISYAVVCSKKNSK